MEDTSGGMLEGPGLYPDPSVNTGYQTTWGRQGREPEKVEFDLTGPGKSTIANNLVDNIVDTRSACEYENTNQVPNTQDQPVDTDASSQEKSCVDVMSSEKTTSNSGLTVLMLAPLLALASTQSNQSFSCPNSQEILLPALYEEDETQVDDKATYNIQNFDSFNPGITHEESEEVMVDLLYSDPMCRKLLLIEKASTKKGGDSERLIFENIKQVRLDVEFSESDFPKFSESDYPSNIPTKTPLKSRGLIEAQERLNNFLVSQKEKMLDLLPTDRTQKNIGKTFQTEFAKNELQGEGLTGDLGSNTPWNQWVKEEFCQQVLDCQKKNMLDQRDLFQTDGTQKIVFQNEAASNDSHEKDLTGDHGSNSPWKKCVKEESCQRVFKQNPPWQELDIKGERMKVFGMESSMSIPVHDSYKIAVLL